MDTMKAVRIHKYGGPEVLTYEDAPRPQPGAGEVLIRVHAAGVNPVDRAIREGYFKERLQYKLPFVPGWDVAGVVETVGSGVTRLKPGDEVYGRTDLAREGSYAEYMVARESEIALKPKSIDFVTAAAIPLAALTAWQALFDNGQLSAGQTVLIHGAAGGVGHFAVQLAKIKGARVIATASQRNQEFLRSLGADQVIDKAEPFEKSITNVDLVFDLVDGETQERSWAVLRQGGTMISTLTKPSAERAKARGARGEHYVAQPDADELREIGDLIDAGKVRPHIEAVFRLAEAGAAQRQLETQHNRGKIVLEVVAESR